jgi:putative chitinase
MNRRSFYDAVRDSLFDGRLSPSQVEGIEALVDVFEQKPGFDRRWFAYILATAYHETARTMQPIEEYGKGKGRPYGKPDPQTGKTYYGRGYVQLTWKYNYEKMGKKLSVDLVNNPPLALEPDVAARIAFDGMVSGDFTGVKLAKVFDKNRSDWYQARKIINGLDRASDVANYGRKFYAAILTATDPALAARTLDPMPDPEALAQPRAVAGPEGAREYSEEDAAIIAEFLGRPRH